MKKSSNDLVLQEPNAEAPKEDASLQLYKKKLLVTVVFAFLISFIIILERIFFEQIIDLEASFVSRIQKSWGLIVYKPKTQYASFIQNGFFKVFGSLDMFEISFLIQTHFYVTFYVGINAIIAIKIIYISNLGQYFVGLLQLIYQGPRPYWTNAGVASPVCLQGFGHPSRDIFMFLFILYYTTYCYRNKYNKQNYLEQGNLKRNFLVIQILMSLVGLLYFFLQYIMGQIFMCSLIISVLYFTVYFFIFIMIDSYTEDLIRKSTIASIDSKKYVFYWFFWILFAILFNQVIFSGCNKYLQIDWVQNFIYCKEGENKIPTGTSYDEMIGSWYTFQNSTVLMAQMGAIFGIAHCFRHIKEFDWYKGTRKLRVQRMVVANLLMIPSWVLIAF